MIRMSSAAHAAVALMIASPALALAQSGTPVARPAKTHAAATTDAGRADTAKSGAVTVNKYMSYDPSTKTVNLQVFAADGSANGGMNFNGGARGDQTITIPQGWTVKMSFKNKDAIPHSAIIVADKLPFPATMDQPAIPRAYTNDVVGGIPTDGTDQTTFKTSTPGKYLLACGVPGHAPSGMYVNFVVSADATAPTYK
jgi:sulfocyanin